MMRTLIKNNLWILTAGGIAVGIYLIGWWGAIPLEQRLAGLFIVAITAHEWEESRFPGGFTDLMIKKLGIPKPDAYTVARSRAVVLVAIVFFAYVPFFCWQWSWLLLVPAFLGCFESLIHVAGIWIHHLRRPYTPGMATALLLMLPVSVVIICVVAPAMPWWGWLCAALYYVACFAAMEVGVLRTLGLTPRDMPKIVRHALGKSAA